MARKTLPPPAPHLRDLFKSGQLVTITVNSDDPLNPVKVEIWMRKPLSWQYEEAVTIARAKQMRRRKKLLDSTTNENEAYRDQVEQEDREALVEDLVKYEEPRIRQTAYNEVLYEPTDEHPKGRWGKDGMEYTELLNAARQRYEEIKAYNEGVEGSGDRISLETDEELLRLNKSMDEFQEQVAAREKELMEQERAKHKGKSEESLRQKLFEKVIDTDASLVFYQEYKLQMIFWACRFPDDHNKPYFSSVDEIWELPDSIRAALMNEFDALESGVDDIKNSLSLLLS